MYCNVRYSVSGPERVLRVQHRVPRVLVVAGARPFPDAEMRNGRNGEAGVTRTDRRYEEKTRSSSDVSGFVLESRRGARTMRRASGPKPSAESRTSCRRARSDYAVLNTAVTAKRHAADVRVYDGQPTAAEWSPAPGRLRRTPATASKPIRREEEDGDIDYKKERTWTRAVRRRE